MKFCGRQCAGLSRVTVVAALCLAAGATHARRDAADALGLVRAQEGVVNLRTGDVLLAQQPDLLAEAAFPGGRVLIQLDGPLSRTRAAMLSQAGVELCGYLPTNCYLADVSGPTPARVLATGLVRSVHAYLDSWKLDPAVAADADVVSVNLWLFEGADPAAVNAAVAAMPGVMIGERERVGPSTRRLA